jgi:hypothetical protein
LTAGAAGWNDRRVTASSSTDEQIEEERATASLPTETPSRAALPIVGAVIDGKYKLEALVGRGGMGVG